MLDVTPFLVYFIENVYHKLDNALPVPTTTATFDAAFANGKITGKEHWFFDFQLPVVKDICKSNVQLASIPGRLLNEFAATGFEA